MLISSTLLFMGRKSKAGTGDQEQTETGADVNALRNNFQVGEQKDLEIVQVAQDDDGDFVVNAKVAEGDADKDKVKSVTDGRFPKQGEIWKFTRTEEGMTMAFVSEAVKAPEAAADTGTEAKPEGEASAESAQ